MVQALKRLVGVFVCYLLNLKCFQLKITFIPKWHGFGGVVWRRILISFRCYLSFFGEGPLQLTSLEAQTVKNLPAK